MDGIGFGLQTVEVGGAAEASSGSAKRKPGGPLGRRTIADQQDGPAFIAFVDHVIQVLSRRQRLPLQFLKRRGG